VEACTAFVAETGILLVQDAALPSVTTIVTGAAVRGSWWSHEQAHSIFDVLQELRADTTTAKLVAAKQTLVHRTRWPELAAVGAEGAPWQADRLPTDARAVVDAVLAHGGAVRADTLEVGAGRTRAEIVRDVARRLLLHVDEVHTETGRHAKVLWSWTGWAEAEGVTAPLPDPATARVCFETALARQGATKLSKLLPWPLEVTS
jgi:hypothetical protein